jgi:septal ring factor EnvC (AmiA/AmiB activator)
LLLYCLFLYFAVTTRIRRLLLPLFLMCALPCIGLPDACAQDGPRDIADKQEDLRELRERIEALRHELSASEASRAEATDQLRQSERQISEAQRQLFKLRKDQVRLQDTLRELADQSRQLEATLAQQQAHLEKLLYRQYTRNAPDALQLLLNGDNPNQLTRDLYYLAAIARARAELLADVRDTLKKQQDLTVDAKSRAAELAAVETAQEAQHRELLQQKTARKKILTQIAGKIKTQKQEIGHLQRDEKRLTNLIERLTKLLAEQARKSSPPVRPDLRPDGPENRHLPSAASGRFASLKGRLRLPARGEIVGRFGAPREGGTTWKGLYIRAAEGSEVKAIASGQVVYAEWMRGFGNLLIIDHGAGYLTVYGNNHSLLKQVGERVEGGETVGTAGSSGGEQNSGLYFELRHQGKALDPMKWVSLK